VRTPSVRDWQPTPLVVGLALGTLAKAKALSVGLSNAYFKSLGLPSFFEEVSAYTHGGVAGVGG